MEEKNFALLAFSLGLKTIHISERDTQITEKPKQVDEFVGTWSVDGLLEEGLAPAEMSFGTHEKKPPEGSIFHDLSRNLYLKQKGMQTQVQSWVPSGPILGMLIHHAEAFSIADILTLKDNDATIYRPTVHYAYCPSDATIASLKELEMHHFVPQKEKRILNDEIISGKDELGCLFMGDFGAWWTGSILSIEESRKLAPHQNATTLQVAISVVAAVLYMIHHPNKGICQPEDLNYEEILAFTKPYLGKVVSMPVDWSPLHFFKEITGLSTSPPPEDIWQFTTFLFPPTV